MPPSITITVHFDEKLQEITKTPGYTSMSSQNAPFAFIMQSMFIEYPEIEEKYKPGMIGFTVNGKPPKEYSPMFDGDVVNFFAI